MLCFICFQRNCRTGEVPWSPCNRWKTWPQRVMESRSVLVGLETHSSFRGGHGRQTKWIPHSVKVCQGSRSLIARFQMQCLELPFRSHVARWMKYYLGSGTEVAALNRGVLGTGRIDSCKDNGCRERPQWSGEAKGLEAPCDTGPLPSKDSSTASFKARASRPCLQ